MPISPKLFCLVYSLEFRLVALCMEHFLVPSLCTQLQTSSVRAFKFEAPYEVYLTDFIILVIKDEGGN